MTKSKANARPRGVGPPWTSIRLQITTRTSWMANNAIPDSIITNMICRSLGAPVELNEPNGRSTDSKNTLTGRILNTIKPVTSAFTTMDAAKLVRTIMFPLSGVKTWPFFILINPSAPASQVAISDKLKSAYQMKIDWLTHVCDCQERRNDHDRDTFTPQDPTTVDLWRFRWKTDDRYNNSLCVPMYIGRWSHNRMLWFGQF